MEQLLPHYLVWFCLLMLIGGCATQMHTGKSGDEPLGGDKISEMADVDQLSSEQLVQLLIEKAERNASLNAFISLDKSGALARARELDRMREEGRRAGLLHGVPLVVKDNIHVAGLPNTAGTPGLKEYIPDADSPVIASLKEAGAIILGKTNMHELAFGITSNNFAYGAVANPHDRSKFAGGSSGGTASAIAAELAPAGLGTDTGGSVRLPSALTGIAALRPTMGRYSQQGVTPVSTTRDTVGPMARSVAEVALLDAVICGENPEIAEVELSQVRLGVPRRFFYQNLDPETERLTEAALQKLKAAGVTLVDADIPELETILTQTAFPIALYEVVRDLRTYLNSTGSGISLEQLAAAAASPDVKQIFSLVLGESAVEETAYRQALELRKSLQQKFAEYLTAHQLDAIVFPTTPLPARNIEGSMETVELNGEQVPTFATYIRNTDLASVTGTPGLTLPIGKTVNGLPVGIELDGPANSDRRLLAIGLALESLFLYRSEQ